MDHRVNGSIDRRSWIGKVVVLDAEPGKARSNYLQECVAEAAQTGALTWLLDCDREKYGPWAGLNALLHTILPELQRDVPQFVTRHDYELAMILPELRRTINVRNPTLTDSSPSVERTRNYPADRAFRIVHGLIDLLAKWYTHCESKDWCIVCDNIDKAGALVQRFLVELLRRRGQHLRLTLIVAAAPGTAERIFQSFETSTRGEIVTMDVPADPVVHGLSTDMLQQAQELVERIGDDRLEKEIFLPELMCYWPLDSSDKQSVRYRYEAMAIYTTRGLYEDALFYGEPLRAIFEQSYPDEFVMRLGVYHKLYNCYAALGRPHLALEVCNTVLAWTDDPHYLCAWYYMLSMLYTRYLPERDFAQAELCLERGLEAIERSDFPSHIRAFKTAFNRNGLALIRHFQKRPAEAIQLCEMSLALLNEHLAPDEHLLHRSVLLYNIAQVYNAMQCHDDAITYYTMAMQMDPNYSEYYNERGNIYLRMGRLAEAERDYRMAIDLSPPYQEVWTNLGQCYAQMGSNADAIAAYSRALDLDPQQFLAYLGRGQAHQELGNAEEALADYAVALALDPNQPLILANRAILHFEAERLHDALADLNQAIELAPDTADLYQNRAVALLSLGREAEALRDLQTYLHLNPAAEDRTEIEEQIAALV